MCLHIFMPCRVFIGVCCVLSRGCACAWISSSTLLWGIVPSSSASSCCCISWRKIFPLLAGSSLSTALKRSLWRPSYTWTATKSSLSLRVRSCRVPIQSFTPAPPSRHNIYRDATPWWCPLLSCPSFGSHHSRTNQCGQPERRGNVEDTAGSFRQESAEECALPPWQREGKPVRVQTGVFTPRVTEQPASWVALIGQFRSEPLSLSLWSNSVCKYLLSAS